MDDLTGRVAVVTGAAHGVGRALALECAKRGMDVVVADIEREPAEQTAKEVESLGRKALAVGLDVSERSQVDALADRAYDTFGAVHLLFNNAGVCMHAKIAEAQPADWDWIFAVDLWGPLHGIQAFLPRMQAQEGPAHIVNTASMSGLIHRHNQRGVYEAAKHALVAMTDSLRDELEAAGSNVSASTFCPGGMTTAIEDSGRRRQDRFGGPVDLGAHPIARQPDPMSPEVAAPRVLEAVLENRRYIFSHPDKRGDLERHYERILEDLAAAERIADRLA